MHIAADLKVIAFLSALLIPALGALTTEQITVGLQDLTDDINDVNDYAESLTVLDADLDTDDLDDAIDFVTSSVETFNSNLAGTTALTEAEQVEVVEAIVPLTDAAKTLLDTLASEVKDHTDFVLPEDDSAVDEAADNLSNSLADTIADLAALGAIIAESGDADESDVIDAKETLDDDAAEDQLTKKFRFRRH